MFDIAQVSTYLLHEAILYILRMPFISVKESLQYMSQLTKMVLQFDNQTPLLSAHVGNLTPQNVHLLPSVDAVSY